MTGRQQYTYTILRYIHDVVTGEFINVGVVMHAADSGLIKTRFRSSIGRIKNTFPDLDRDSFLRSVKSVERAIKSYQKSRPNGDLIDRQMTAISISKIGLVTDDSSLQWSVIGSGISSDFEKAFERIYNRFVSKYDTRSPHRRTDDEVWRPVKQMLDARNVPVDFNEKTISGKADEISFKRAWKNGVWHAYEPLSFDLVDADGIKDKARRWRGHLEAVHDGAVEDLKISFIVGAPANPALVAAYDGALRILENSPFHPKIYNENEIDQLVNEIEDDVREYLNYA